MSMLDKLKTLFSKTATVAPKEIVENLDGGITNLVTFLNDENFLPKIEGGSRKSSLYSDSSLGNHLKNWYQNKE